MVVGLYQPGRVGGGVVDTPMPLNMTTYIAQVLSIKYTTHLIYFDDKHCKHFTDVVEEYSHLLDIDSNYSRGFSSFSALPAFCSHVVLFSLAV